MYFCPKCKSENLQKRGTRKTKKMKMFRQFKCNECTHRFDVELPEVNEELTQESSAKKFVLTYYQKGTEINYNLLRTLISYSNYNNAQLMVLTNENEFDEDFQFSQYFVSKNFTIGDDIVVYSKLNISPTAENPLTGLDSLSKGKSLIVGHNAMAMKMLPVFGNSHPIMMHTTGTISIPNYNTEKKSGAKAEHNHSYSAIVIELEDDKFHFRQLNSGDDGTFYDIDKFYDADTVSDSGGCEAIILGDVHVAQMDESVLKATYTDNDSIVNTVKPKRIVLHDLYDHHQGNSHHNVNSVLTRYSMFVSGDDSVVKELNQTCQFLVDNTPDFVEENLVVSSNHNDHLRKWLESSFDKLFDYKNLKIYHWLMYKSLDNIETGKDVNPFRDYFQNFYGNSHAGKVTNFLGRDENYFVGDILVSVHGDRGVSGKPWSPTSLKRLPHKMVIGHQHQPSIQLGSWVAGTCTPLRLGYTEGSPTQWLNSHILIHKNFKRQMINIVKGSWRSK